MIPEENKCLPQENEQGSHIMDENDESLFHKHLLFSPQQHKKYIAEEYYYQQNEDYFKMEVAP